MRAYGAIPGRSGHPIFTRTLRAMSPAARALRALLAPRVLVGIGAGLTLLVVIGGLADWREVQSAVSRLPPWLLALSAGGALLGGALRAARWVLMLRLSGVQVSVLRALAAHFGAELLGPLPASPFAAAYLLHRGGVSAVASAPVVLAAFWTDALFAMTGTAVVPSAPAGIRLLAAIGVAGLLAGALLVWLLPRVARGLQPLFLTAATWGERRLRWVPWLSPLWRLLGALPGWAGEGSRAFQPRALVAGVLLIAPAWVLGCVITSLITQAAGYDGMTPWRVWATAGTQFVATLASPLPFDFGVSEGAGVLAYSWAGVPAAVALTVSLVSRLWSLTLNPLVVIVAAWLLRRELDSER
jgi:uncharacterized protein (TIRG00374 family)